MARRGCFVIPIKSESEIGKVVEEHKVKALVVGDTLQDLRNYDTQLIILRPLVGAA